MQSSRLGSGQSFFTTRYHVHMNESALGITRAGVLRVQGVHWTWDTGGSVGIRGEYLVHGAGGPRTAQRVAATAWVGPWWRSERAAPLDSPRVPPFYTRHLTHCWHHCNVETRTACVISLATLLRVGSGREAISLKVVNRLMTNESQLGVECRIETFRSGATTTSTDPYTGAWTGLGAAKLDRLRKKGIETVISKLPID